MKHVLCILGKVFQSIEWHFNSTETCCNIHNSHCCMLATYDFFICLRLLKGPTRMFNKTPTQKKKDILKAQPIFSSFPANETSVQPPNQAVIFSSHGKERTCFKILPLYIVTSHEWCLNIYDSRDIQTFSHHSSHFRYFIPWNIESSFFRLAKAALLRSKMRTFKTSSCNHGQLNSRFGSCHRLGSESRKGTNS